MSLNLEQYPILGTERVVEKFVLIPRIINNKMVWLRKIKIIEVYSELFSLELDYNFCSVFAEKKWIEKSFEYIG
jgi:hypothetical protein